MAGSWCPKGEKGKTRFNIKISSLSLCLRWKSKPVPGSHLLVFELCVLGNIDYFSSHLFTYNVRVRPAVDTMFSISLHDVYDLAIDILETSVYHSVSMKFGVHKFDNFQLVSP